VLPQSSCACRYEVADVGVDGGGGIVVAWRREARRAADVAAVTALPARGPSRRTVGIRPVPLVSGVDLATDGGPGAAAVWAGDGVVGVLVRHASR
jgi:hypothetical protein